MRKLTVSWNGLRMPLGILLLALAVGGALPAFADTNPAQQSNTFESADRDGDGRLDRNEYDEMSRSHGAMKPHTGEGMPATEHQANVIYKFEERDRDGDGYVTSEELDMQAGD
ncbi:MAG: EF-hand domain-containing protein [Gammaproteobacteria bacterium]|nr:EF-hand domain-containing protein [Gammaproteobacteria bacterium]